MWWYRQLLLKLVFFCDIVGKIDHMKCKCTSNNKHGKQPASFQHLGISHLSPTTLGNQEILRKFHYQMETESSAQSLFEKQNFGNSSKNQISKFTGAFQYCEISFTLFQLFWPVLQVLLLTRKRLSWMRLDETLASQFFYLKQHYAQYCSV